MRRKYKMLGNVDLLGLNEYGNNPGLSPIWGTLIGGGVAGVTSLVAGQATSSPTLQNNREIIGLGAGLATAGVMYAMRGTRHAAIGAALGAFLASGLAWLEKTIFGTVQLPAATAAVATQVAAAAGGATTTTTPAAGTSGRLGISTTRALNGLGIATTRALNGLGIATTASVPRAAGTIPGVAGLRLGNGSPPVNLMGPMTPASQQVRLMGGPPISGMAGHWGATHFSR